MNVIANWSGSYPWLCMGEWSLEIDGVDYSDYIPFDLRDSPMDTYGTYSFWYFDETFCEVFETYNDGWCCEHWINENAYWLKNISKDTNDWKNIYKAFQKNDWRSGSCGGCI